MKKLNSSKNGIVVNELIGWILLIIGLFVIILVFVMIGKRGQGYIAKLTNYLNFGEAVF